MPMQLIMAKILANALHMRFADHYDPKEAEYWLDFQTPLDDLKIHPGATAEQLGNIQKRFVGSVQLAALNHARDIKNLEINALLERRSISKHCSRKAGFFFRAGCRFHFVSP
jgi:hypothetical protein